MLKEKVFDHLRKNNKTISFVESCTGGGLCRDFVLISGVSEVLRGSLVAYQDFSKIECLEIDKGLIVKHTSVSGPVAKEMSKKGAAFFKSDYCLAVTGWAGPAGGTSADPVGTVYFAVCGESSQIVERRTFKECNDRKELMKNANEYAWKLLGKALGISP